jgi:hypothetical protein
MSTLSNSSSPLPRRGRPPKRKRETNNTTKKQKKGKENMNDIIEEFLVDSGGLSHILSEEQIKNETIQIQNQNDICTEWKHTMELEVYFCINEGLL